MHPILNTMLVERLILEYLVSLNYVPHKRVDVAKSQDDSALAIWRNSSNTGHVPREFSQVCWYFIQKSGSKLTWINIVSCQWWQETKGDWWFGRVCLCLQGEQEHWLLCSLSNKSFKLVYKRFTDYPKLCKCNWYSIRCSSWVFKQIKPTWVRIWELKRGTYIWRGPPAYWQKTAVLRYTRL